MALGPIDPTSPAALLAEAAGPVEVEGRLVGAVVIRSRAPQSNKSAFRGLVARWSQPFCGRCSACLRARSGVFLWPSFERASDVSSDPVSIPRFCRRAGPQWIDIAPQLIESALELDAARIRARVGRSWQDLAQCRPSWGNVESGQESNNICGDVGRLSDPEVSPNLSRTRPQLVLGQAWPEFGRFGAIPMQHATSEPHAGRWSDRSWGTTMQHGPKVAAWYFVVECVCVCV